VVFVNDKSDEAGERAFGVFVVPNSLKVLEAPNWPTWKQTGMMRGQEARMPRGK